MKIAVIGTGGVGGYFGGKLCLLLGMTKRMRYISSPETSTLQRSGKTVSSWIRKREFLPVYRLRQQTISHHFPSWISVLSASKGMIWSRFS